MVLGNSGVRQGNRKNTKGDEGSQAYRASQESSGEVTLHCGNKDHTTA